MISDKEINQYLNHQPMSINTETPQSTVYKQASRIRSALKHRPNDGDENYLKGWDKKLSLELVRLYDSILSIRYVVN